MKKIVKSFVIVGMLLFLSAGLSACGGEGEAEKAGKEIDKAFDSAKNKLKEVTE